MEPATERRQQAATRDLVLDAAERCFADHGYAATSLGEIGRAAGVSRAAPSYFFRSKDNLYHAVLERLLDRVGRRLAGAYTAVEPDEEGVERIVRNHLDVLASEPSLLRLLEWERLEGRQPPDTMAPLAERPLAFLRAVAARHGSQTNDLRPLLLGAVALCWFPLAHAATLVPVIGLDLHDPATLDAHARSVADFVLAHLRPREQSA